jgi:hypothetical protein
MLTCSLYVGTVFVRSVLEVAGLQRLSGGFLANVITDAELEMLGQRITGPGYLSLFR